MATKDRKSFRIYFYNNEEDDALLKWLDSNQKGSVSFVKDILQQVKDGKLKDMSNLDLPEKKLLADIRVKEATARIKEQEAIWWETFRRPPSWQGQRAINQTNTERPLSKIDEKNKRFYCYNCEEVFNWRNNPLPACKEAFIDHWYKAHKGDPPNEFLNQLGELRN